MLRLNSSVPKQALLTYHHGTWVLGRPGWNFNDAAEPLAAAAQACRDDPFVQNLNCELERDVLRIADQFPLDSWSVSLELCPDTFATSGVLRLHVHLALVFCKQTRVYKAQHLSLAGAVPAHSNRTGAIAFNAVRHCRNYAPLHDYLQMPKQGGVWPQTNLAVFKKCPVNPRWITTWLQSDHLTLDAARAEYVKCKAGLLSTLPNLEVVHQEIQRSAIAAKRRIIEHALRADLCKFRDVPEHVLL